MRIIAIVAAAALPLAAARLALAEPAVPDRPIARPIKAVVELFTSQGCSSCPPADRLMKSYAQSGDILAFSLPVDIWDHLGWKDTLASPKNSERQRAYARNFNQGPVYTPQTVINGIAHAVGSRQDEINSAIEADRASFSARRVPVSFVKHESIYMIDLGAAPAGTTAKRATVWLGVVQNAVSVPIKRGENSGASVTYYNVVRDLVPVGAWDGTAKQLQLTSAAVLHAGSEDTFVLLQEDEYGPIIGATWLGR